MKSIYNNILMQYNVTVINPWLLRRQPFYRFTVRHELFHQSHDVFTLSGSRRQV